MREIEYLGRKPYGVSYKELSAAVDREILLGRNPTGIAFGNAGQLFLISRSGRIDIDESPDTK